MVRLVVHDYLGEGLLPLAGEAVVLRPLTLARLGLGGGRGRRLCLLCQVLALHLLVVCLALREDRSHWSCHEVLTVRWGSSYIVA